MIILKKANDSWKIHVDFSDLNKVCLKDTYLLPNIDKLVNRVFSLMILSFCDAFFKVIMKSYMVGRLREKNVGTIYQRMTNKVFKDQIRKYL